MPRMKLHSQLYFEGLSVNPSNGPLRTSDLQTMKDLVDYYRYSYRRTAVVHLTLNVDIGFNSRMPHITNDPICYFSKRFSVYMSSLKLKNVLDMNYVWKIEVGKEGNVHWHMYCLWNYDAMMGLGKDRLQEANRIWRIAIGLNDPEQDLIHVKYSNLRDGMHRNNPQHADETFYWMSYIAKLDRSGKLNHLKRLFQPSEFPRLVPVL